MAKQSLHKYIAHYEAAWLEGMKAKCGLTESRGINANHDKALIESLLQILDENSADFTLTFYYLSQLGAEPDDKDAALRDLFAQPEALDEWLVRWRQRLKAENSSDTERQAGMQQVNPVYIPRNHQIEAVIRAAEDHHDFAPFHALLAVLEHPFTYQPGKDSYMQAPQPEQIVHKTFCGT